MIAALFDQWMQCCKKVMFQYNILTNRFDYLSPAFETIWEMDRKQVLQFPENLFSIVEEQDREAVALRYEKVRQGQGCEIEFSLQLPGNRSKQVKVEAHPIVDAAGALTYIMGQAEDVTEQMQYREYLLEFSQKKDNVLQIVAHDLQGPLAVMKSVTNLLVNDHAAQDYKEVTTYTDIIHRAYADCTKLIKDVLQDEHIKSIATPVRRSRFEAVAKVRQVAETFVQSHVVKVPLQVNSRAEGMMVELDEVKFGQILNNLIINSIKFTPPTGEITITLEQQGATLLITHADTGIGIPKDLQPHLFDKHNKKAARLGLNGEQSNGIGLAIVKDLVELQGGQIRVESEEEKGTTFYLSFPVHLHA